MSKAENEKILELAKKAVSDGVVEVVYPEPHEEKLLNDIFGDNFKQLQMTAAMITGKELEEHVKGSMKMAVLPAYNIKAINDWVGAAFQATNAVYELGLAFHNYLSTGEKRRMREKRFKKQAKTLKEELIEMMITSTDDESKDILQTENKKEELEMVELIRIGKRAENKPTKDEKLINFEKTLHVYLARYYTTYFIDNIFYDSGDEKGEKGETKKSHKNVRFYPSIENYEEFFTFQGTLSEKIDKQRDKLVDLNIDNEIPNTKYYRCSCCNCRDSHNYSEYVKYIVNKNYLDFVKKDYQDEFAVKFKLYRAYMKLGEFNKQNRFGDRNEVRRALLCTLFLGIGLIPGIYYSVCRIISEVKWRKNKPRLNEAMRAYLKVESKLDEVIRQKYAIEKLKYYIDLTKSKYGKYLLERNLKEISYEFKNESCMNSFDVAFDLMQKMCYTGTADRLNYVHLNIEYKKDNTVCQ
ncbi:uncharacterized protein LOC136084852 [Hydra vulgaris]|uniref:Uncharacterized protein LOC136084852 n=1 Tax=Hydra vulgaris TaxID=6087 RepID=A0ABM4CJW8_HYDVU